MKIHELQLTSIEDRKRRGRGISAGQGKTAGRGTKGQNSRTGGGVRPGFEGGQNPLAKRLPKKRGFVPISQVEYQVVNLSQIDRFKADSVIDAEAIVAAGLAKKATVRIKLLASGAVTKKFTVKVHRASAAAKAAIEAAGGTVEIVELPRVASKKATRPKVEEQVQA